jgi:Undecaprenyl-phosphate galactose phosphotransferase WbaP
MSRTRHAVEDRLVVESSQITIGHRLARNVLLGGSDALMLCLAVAIAFMSWAAPIRHQSAESYLALAPLIVIFLAGYASAGLYPNQGLGPVQTLRRLSYVTTFGFLMVAAFSFVLKLPHVYSRVTFLIALGLSLALVPLGRVALFSMAQRWPWWAEPVVVIGTGRLAVRAIGGIKNARSLGYRPVAVIQSDPRQGDCDSVDGVPVVGGLDQVAAVSASGIHVAFIEMESLQSLSVLDRLQQCFRHVIVVNETHDLPVEGLQVRNLGSLIGIEYTNNLLRPVNQTAKRLLDLVLGIAAFVLFAPLIAVAGLLVLLIDGGPVFFHQSRTGLAGRRIKVPKIRTMRRDAEGQLEEHLLANPALRDEWQTRFKLSEDPRLIPIVGRFFRRFSIDELPQLWAVIRGDMSLVGPRPFPDYHLEQFAPRFSELRQSVRPGITGWWQVAVRSDGGINEQEAFDTYYIRNWSVWFDLYILSRTAMAVLSGRGAY